MTLQELAAKVQDLLTQIPAQTQVVPTGNLTSDLALVVVNDDGVTKVVIGEP